MKLKMYFMMLALGFMSVVMASCSDDDDNGISVPTELESAFVNEFGNVAHSWSTSRSGYHVAKFEYNRQEKEAWFNDQGEWMMTETDILFEALPESVKNAYAALSQYAGWKVDDVDMLERNGMETIFVVEIEKGNEEVDLYFDAKGNLLKEVVDTDQDDDSESYLPVALKEAVIKVLNDKFPGYKLLEIEREKNGSLEVDILHSGQKFEVIFDQADQWVASKKEIPMSQVPQVVKQAALDAHPGAVIDDEEAELVETPAGTYYLIELEKGDQDIYVKVQEDGTILS